MKTIRTVLPAMLIICSLLSGTAVFAVDEPISLTHGQVSGLELDSGVQAFLGIPFAAAPVGDLRWKAPQPPIPWQGKSNWLNY